MDLLEKHKNNLIVQRALTLFFYNFDTYPDIIEEMKVENSGFNHGWEKLSEEAKERSKKTGWPATIDYTDIYGFFATKLTYKAQALLLEKVLNVYGEEAKGNIDFSIEMDVAATKARNIQKEKQKNK